MKAVFGDQAYKPGFMFLIDRRLAQAPTTDYIERVVAFARQHQKKVAGSRWAVVVAGSATFGMVRLGQILAKGLPTASCLFRKLEDAEHWLSGE